METPRSYASVLFGMLSWEDNIDDVNCMGGGGGYFTPTAPEPPKQVKYALRVFASSSLYFLTIAGRYSEMINLLVTDE